MSFFSLAPAARRNRRPARAYGDISIPWPSQIDITQRG
jgi:hypothetical protein